MITTETVLKAVYQDIFDQDLNYETFDDRLKAQKIVYLLQEMGLSIGDYGFRWYKFGPYSQAVQDDIFRSSHITVNQDLKFKKYARQILDQLKKYINNHSDYNTAKWLEAIASIHYLKKNLFPGNDDSFILEELKRRKPKLNSAESNLRALEIVNEILQQVEENAVGVC